MAAHITLLRHAETDANASDIWQGWGDAPLTEVGQDQAARVGARLAKRSFDVVVASDLGRTTATASAAGVEAEADAAWRELEMGEWDGLARSEIFDRFPDQLVELRAGKDIRWGGGETYGEFTERVELAFAQLTSRLGPNDHALVVTHGGVIHALVAGLLGFRSSAKAWPIGRIFNTAMTTIAIRDGSQRIEVFNDAAHLDLDSQRQHFSGPEAVLLRHGSTLANEAGQWHGLTDGPMSGSGERQAALLGEWRVDLAEIWHSPLSRARRTAEIVADGRSVPLGEDERLIEFDYGSWEDLTTAQIEEQFSEEWSRYRQGEDVPRGGTGDTTAAVSQRMSQAVMARANGEGRVGFVSHGGSIRSYVAGVLGLHPGGRFMLADLNNTSATTVALTKRGPVLTDYNLTPHLEG